MSFLNLETKLRKPKFWLCKPNFEVIHPLNDAYNINLSVSIGGLDELNFTIPSMVSRNNKIVKNPLFKKIHGDFVIKMLKDGIESYFTIVKRKKNYSESDETIDVQCLSLQQQLGKRLIRSYEADTKTIRVIATELLEDTNWTVDYIDGDIELLFRSFEASSNILQAILDLSDKFNCVPEWDTKNLKVSFKKYENIGINRGLQLKDDKFIESFNLEINDEEVVTRLKAYGQDGLEFRSLSPTGNNYIEDFGWFMYPFECDTNYNVIKKSNYMSDELCIALTKYYHLLDSVDGQFNSIKDNLTTYQADLVVLKENLQSLENDLVIINNDIDVINYTYQDQAPSRPEHIQLMIDKANKQVEIDNKKAEITAKETQINLLYDDLDNLRILIAMENNFTLEEAKELKNYIKEYEYTNDSITEEQDLLDEAVSIFNDYRQPSLNLSVSLETFTKFFNTRLYKKIYIGDTVKLKSERMEVDLYAKITNISYDFDNEKVGITLSNVRNSLNGDEAFVRQLTNAINTTNTVNIDKYKWNQGEYANTMVNQILTSEFDTAKNVLIGGYANSVQIDSRGLYSRDLDDPNTVLVLNNGLLAISSDNGNTISTSISKRGVHSERLVGQIILGNQLYIESNTGIIHVDGDTATFYDNLNNKKLELGKYDLDGTTKHGIKIYGGAIDLRTSSAVDRGLQLDSNGLRTFNTNGVKTFDLNANTGQVDIIGAINIKTSADTNRGVVFDGNGISAYDSSNNRKFYVDTNGNLSASSANITGTINASGGTITGTLNVTGGLTGGTFSSGTFTTGTITSSTLNSNTINSSTVNSTNINGGTITGSLFQTTSNFNRGVKIDSNGLRLYDSNGNITVNLNSNDGSATFNGNITSGSTITGATINGADIIGGNISVSSNVTVGKRLFLSASSSFGDYGIQFGSNSTSWTNSYILSNYNGSNWTNLNVHGAGGLVLSTDGIISLNGYSLDASGVNTVIGLAQSDTNNLSVGYSSASGRFYVKVNNVNVGYVDLIQ